MKVEGVDTDALWSSVIVDHAGRETSVCERGEGAVVPQGIRSITQVSICTYGS